MDLKIKKYESWLDFSSRVILNYKDYGFQTKEEVITKLTGVPMRDNSRKIHYGLRNLQKAYENGYYKQFLGEQSNVGNNVLCIGDLHTPFEHKDYLEFCKKIYKKYNCDTVVFLGDILDCHYSSYHETSPDGFGGEEELLRAKKSIAEYHRTFPNSKVCIGNHDAIPNRKAFSGGLSKQWVKSMGEVLETPTWSYADHFVIDGVKYTHGTGRKARQRSQQDMLSLIQGHYHSESYIENYVGADGTRRFAMQIGCGINIDEYAFAYGRHFAKPHLCAGVVIGGKLPIIEFMD